MTANKIFTYGDLDKQYSLKAQNGKTLVSSSLHDAYQSTNSLSDFLKKFGLVSDVAYSVEITERNPAYDNAVDRYEGDYEQWQQEMEDYEKAYQDYLNKHKYWEETEYPNWEADEPQRDDPKYIMTTENLGDKFKDAGSSCYNAALGGGFGCYQHILAHIIDYGTTTGFGTDGCNESWYNGTNNKYTTSTGKSFVISSSEITGAGMDDDGGTKCQTMKEVSEKIDDETHYKAAVKEGETCDVNASSTEGEKLLSKWNTDGTLKSIKQWAKDLFYLCDNYNSLRITSAQLKQSVTDFKKVWQVLSTLMNHCITVITLFGKVRSLMNRSRLSDRRLNRISTIISEDCSLKTYGRKTVREQPSPTKTLHSGILTSGTRWKDSTKHLR